MDLILPKFSAQADVPPEADTEVLRPINSLEPELKVKELDASINEQLERDANVDITPEPAENLALNDMDESVEE